MNLTLLAFITKNSSKGLLDEEPYYDWARHLSSKIDLSYATGSGAYVVYAQPVMLLDGSLYEFRYNGETGILERIIKRDQL